MGPRSLLAVAGWLVAAALAVFVGLGAIAVIGAGLTSDATPALSAAEVDRELRGSSGPPASATPGGSPASPGTDSVAPPGAEPVASPGTGAAQPGAEPVARLTRGGTVVARCAGTRAEIISMSPAQGFEVHDKDRGARDAARGEFRGSADGHDRVEVTVTCRGGAVQVTGRSGRDDD